MITLKVKIDRADDSGPFFVITLF